MASAIDRSSRFHSLSVCILKSRKPPSFRYTLPPLQLQPNAFDDRPPALSPMSLVPELDDAVPPTRGYPARLDRVPGAADRRAVVVCLVLVVLPHTYTG